MNSDADETKNWINEKDKVLSSDDYGKDLASVNALLRKHEALERDLAAVEDKVKIVFPERQYIFQKLTELLHVVHENHCVQGLSQPDLQTEMISELLQ